MTGGRASIRMTPDEITAFLTTTRSVTLATIGPTGRPHLVAMWFALDGDELVMWSYGKSQKVRNLDRDARASCLAEDGDAYGLLRGVAIDGIASLSSARSDVEPAWAMITEKYTGGEITADARANFERQAAKRVAIRVSIDSVTSWDHRRLESLPSGVP